MQHCLFVHSLKHNISNNIKITAVNNYRIMTSRRRRMSVDKLIIFAATLCYIVEICGKICGEQIAIEDLKQETNLDKFDGDVDKRGPPGGMWFGPRLGKRSQPPSVDYNQILALQQLLESAIASENGVTFGPGTKRRFTPRLGRESSEQDIFNTLKNEDFKQRFGREMTPMMLKELLNAENDINMSSLYGRAIVDDKRPPSTDSKIPPFAPRLGRQLFWPVKTEYLGPLRESGHRYVRSAEKSAVKIHKT